MSLSRTHIPRLATLRFASLGASALVLFVAGCKGEQAPVTATKLALATPPSASAQNRVAFPAQPKLQLTDDQGRAAHTSGVVVTATVTSGTGSAFGTTTATTDANGVATFTGLAIAGPVGIHDVEFSAPSLGSISASVTTTPGLPAILTILAGDAQTTLAGTAVTVPPSVRVTDADGNIVSGATVTFTVTQGGGTLLGATQQSSLAGVATVTRWTLGNTAGTNTVTATVTGATPAQFTAFATSSDFNIGIVYRTSVTQAQRDAFDAAVAKWRRVITGDIGSVDVQTDANQCTPAIHAIVNDVRIYVTLEPIDGVGQVLGSAGPCFIQDESRLTVVGAMRFDTADLANLENNGQLTTVILHEMGHVLGIGSLWQEMTPSLLTGAGGSDPFFTGAEAIARFNSIGGSSFVGNRVPVENTGGGGTRDSHWRESVFRNELMTGFIDNSSNPMSAVTIGSLKDLGYTVNFAEAQNFLITATSGLLLAPSQSTQLVNDVLPFIPGVVARGRPATPPKPRR